MKIGIGVSDITPPVGSTTLSGWSARGDKPSEGKYDDLNARSIAFDGEGGRGIIVTLDLLGLNRKLSDEMKSRLSSEFEVSPLNVLITASHTHSGPPSGYIDSPIVRWVPEKGYADFLLEAVVDSCRNAFKDLEECDMYLGKGKCGIAINRRKMIDGKVRMAPNEEGVRDEEVVALKVVRRDGTPKTILFHYACHPTTVFSYNITADYPGEARRVIEKGMGSAVKAIFLQGCCGNVRPRLIEGDHFRPGTIEDSRRFGDELGSEVIRICNSSMMKLTPRLFSALKEVELPLGDPPSRKELEEKLEKGNEGEKRWAQVILSYGSKIPSSIPFLIQRFDLAEELSLVGLEGEICVEYQIMIKGLSERTLNLAVGYSNGCIGYVPTAKIIPEGGYEATSIRDWGAPSTFSTRVEEVLMNGVRLVTGSTGGGA